METRSNWTLLQGDASSHNRVFTRDLGANELGFYWDAAMHGTADCVLNAALDIRPGLQSRQLFNPERVSQTWARLKRQHPLLGARIERNDDKLGGGAHFVVDESQFSDIHESELRFLEMSSQEAVEAFIEETVQGPRTIPVNRVAQVYVIRRLDVPNRINVVLLVAHSITDGMAQATILNGFLHIITSSTNDSLSPETPVDLKERLDLSIAAERLQPNHGVHTPKQRWRRAIAMVIQTIQGSKMKGGHSLPRKFHTNTPYTHARSRKVTFSFPAATSARILANCRKLGMTFGTAYPILAQVAMTRLLYRRYQRGEISEEEWQFRKREPMFTGGPLNMRPLLDQEWYNRGGQTAVMVAIGFFYYTLPHMPLGDLSSVPAVTGDTPSFSTFLTLGRFLARCQYAKVQVTRFMKHPLFFELADARHKGRSAIKTLAVQRQAAYPDGNMPVGDTLSVLEQGKGFVFAHGGSSIGNQDALYPARYPPGVTSDEPVVQVSSRNSMLHCRPTELYLGAVGKRGQLYLYVFWDENVFERDVVTEWLEEVKNATEWYLDSSTDTVSRAESRL